MNTKLHDHDHKRHGHRQPDALELYELEHTRAPSERARPQPRHILISDDYYDNTGIEVQPHWRPLKGDNGVIFRPDYYHETERTMQPDRRSPQRYDEGDCKGDVNCEAEMFIRLEHDKFEQSKWMSIKK